MPYLALQIVFLTISAVVLGNVRVISPICDKIGSTGRIWVMLVREGYAVSYNNDLKHVELKPYDPSDRTQHWCWNSPDQESNTSLSIRNRNAGTDFHLSIAGCSTNGLTGTTNCNNHVSVVSNYAHSMDQQWDARFLIESMLGPLLSWSLECSPGVKCVLWPKDDLFVNHRVLVATPYSHRKQWIISWVNDASDHVGTRTYTGSPLVPSEIQAGPEDVTFEITQKEDDEIIVSMCNNNDYTLTFLPWNTVLDMTANEHIFLSDVLDVRSCTDDSGICKEPAEFIGLSTLRFSASAKEYITLGGNECIQREIDLSTSYNLSESTSYEVRQKSAVLLDAFYTYTPVSTQSDIDLQHELSVAIFERLSFAQPRKSNAFTPFQATIAPLLTLNLSKPVFSFPSANLTSTAIATRANEWECSSYDISNSLSIDSASCNLQNQALPRNALEMIDFDWRLAAAMLASLRATESYTRSVVSGRESALSNVTQPVGRRDCTAQNDPLCPLSDVELEMNWFGPVNGECSSSWTAKLGSVGAMDTCACCWGDWKEDVVPTFGRMYSLMCGGKFNDGSPASRNEIVISCGTSSEYHPCGDGSQRLTYVVRSGPQSKHGSRTIVLCPSYFNLPAADDVDARAGILLNAIAQYVIDRPLDSAMGCQAITKLAQDKKFSELRRNPDTYRVASVFNYFNLETCGGEATAAKLFRDEAMEEKKVFSWRKLMRLVGVFGVWMFLFICFAELWSL